MRSLLRVIAGIGAFVIGSGAVAFVESALGSMEVGEISVTGREFKIDRDKWTAARVLSRKIEFNINGVGIDSSDGSIVQNLGRAGRVERDAADYEAGEARFKDYYFDGLMVGTIRSDSGDYSVDMIELEAGPWRFDGIGIGSSVSEVKKAFGEPFRFDRYTLYYNMPQSGASLDIEIGDGVVAKIKAGYGRC